jgi:hypothetical protein
MNRITLSLSLSLSLSLFLFSSISMLYDKTTMYVPISLAEMQRQIGLLFDLGHWIVEAKDPYRPRKRKIGRRPFSILGA